MDDGCNGVVWVRDLEGDFREIRRVLDQRGSATADGTGDGIQGLDDRRLQEAELSPEGRKAANAMCLDLERLRGLGHDPSIEWVQGYPKDDDEIASTDVYSFHVDSSTVPTETILCTYAGRPSEGLRLDQAQRIVENPGTRARLLERFGGQDDERFDEYLRESHLDLHYAALEGAAPFSFGTQNLWRVGVQYPGCPVPAFIHRAPADRNDIAPRLLLIS
jgi:hypothetical protein